jgi:hypothetical protein
LLQLFFFHKNLLVDRNRAPCAVVDSMSNTQSYGVRSMRHQSATKPGQPAI